MTDTARKPGDARREGDSDPFPWDPPGFVPERDLDPVSLAAWQINPDKYNTYVLGNLERYARAYRNHQTAFNAPTTWADWENYAAQVIGRPGADIDSAIALLRSWAASKPEVRAALDVFMSECLAAHLSICAGCNRPIVGRPAPNPRLYHDDACRKRHSRK